MEPKVIRVEPSAVYLSEIRQQTNALLEDFHRPRPSSNLPSAPLPLLVPPMDPREKLIILIQGLFQNESPEEELIKISEEVPAGLMAETLMAIHASLKELMDSYKKKCEVAALQPYSEETKKQVSALFQEYKVKHKELIASEKIKCQPEIDEIKKQLLLRCFTRLLFTLSKSLLKPGNLDHLFYSAFTPEQAELVNKNVFLNNKVQKYYKFSDVHFYIHNSVFITNMGYGFQMSSSESQPFEHSFNIISFEYSAYKLFDVGRESKEILESLSELEKQKENPEFAAIINLALAYFHASKLHNASKPLEFIPHMNKYLSFTDSPFKEVFTGVLLLALERNWILYSTAEQEALDAWAAAFLEKDEEEQRNSRSFFAISYFQHLYKRKKNWPEALKYAKLCSTFDQGAALVLLSHALIQSKEFKKAKEVLSTPEAKKDPMGLVTMGLLTEGEDLSAAANYYREALEAGYAPALMALNRILPYIKINKSFKQLIRQREFKEDPEVQKIIDLFPVLLAKPDRRWSLEEKITIEMFETLFRSSPPSLKGAVLESFKLAKGDLLNDYLKQLNELIQSEKGNREPSDSWSDKKNDLFKKAQKAQESLIDVFVEQQTAEEQKRAFEQKVEKVIGRELEKMEQTLSFWDGAVEEATALRLEAKQLKETFQTRMSALQQNGDLKKKETELTDILAAHEKAFARIAQRGAKLQEKEDEIAKLKKQVAELGETTRNLGRQLKERDEKLEQQEREIEVLENWNASLEELSAEKEEAQSLEEQIKEIEGLDQKCYHKICNLSKVVKKEEMISLLGQFGFKHSTTRGSHQYFVKETGGKKIFCLIYSHSNELKRAERKLCLQRILLSLRDGKIN